MLDPARVACAACAATYPASDGVLDLEPDASLDTKLDVEEYAAANAAQTRLYEKCYLPFLREAGIPADRSVCLEIGSGPGTLTVALASDFGRLYASDLSWRFLAMLRRRIPGDNVTILRFDAQRIPFRPETLHVIVGHSVLHHLLSFEETLAACFEALQDGGIAIFGEPLYPGAALTGLMAAVVREADMQLPPPDRYPSKALAALERLASRTGEVQRLMHRQRADLAPREDKHQFSLAGLSALGRSIGFRRFVADTELTDAGASGGLRQEASWHASRIEAAVSSTCAGFTLKKHQAIVDLFQRAYFAAFVSEPPPACFANFAFIK